MKATTGCLMAALLVTPCCVATVAAAQSSQADIDSAGRLFQAGKFAEASDIYARLAAENPKDYTSILQLGRIALLANRLDDARKWLEKAIALQPAADDAKVMLAEALYRRDDFQRAADALDGVDVSGNKLLIEQYPTLNVAKMRSFKGQTPLRPTRRWAGNACEAVEDRSASPSQRTGQRRR